MKREPHIYTPAHDHRREKLPDPPKCDFVFVEHVTWSGRGENRPFEDYTPQPDTAERTRLAVQSIPFALPEKRNG